MGLHLSQEPCCFCPSNGWCPPESGNGVLSGREAVYVFFGTERHTVALSCFQLLDHCLSVDMRLKTEVYAAVVAIIEQVVALVLCVLHAELFTDELRFR